MRSYSLFDVSEFPGAGEFETDPQIEQVHTEKTTIFSHAGHLDVGFHEYTVQHYSRVKFRGTPFHRQERLDEVTEKNVFSAYLHRDRDYLLVRYAKDVANEVADRLDEAEFGTNTNRPNLNLRSFVRNHAGGLSGSYFREMQVPHVRSSSLFGSHVEESDYFQEMEDLGSLSAVLVTIPHDDDEHKLLISSDYGVGFYEELPPAVELAIFTGRLCT